ncbi:MAG: diguanylate cyclase domain-containing protein, partial [Geminicoccales bacterium]
MPHLAEHDPLTGLPSRLLLQDRLGQAMAHCHRQDDLLALMLIDLDKLQEINDAQGDDLGDRVLQEVALRLRAQLRASDTV